MKLKNPHIGKQLAFIGAMLAVTTAARADFEPIPLTASSFTADVIVEKSATPAPLNVYVNATMDGGTNGNAWTYYEKGYVRYWPETGIPQAGTIFTAQNDGSRQYKMAPNFAANNALLVYNGSPTGTLTFNAATAYSTLTLLSASAGGDATINYVVYYQGGATQQGTVKINDWYSGTMDIALIASGRVNMDNGEVGELNNTGNPKLLWSDIPLNDTTTPVTKVEFSSTGANRAAIFAISGFDGAGYVPINVSGYNRDMIVEKAAPETGHHLDRTTVTMDGGAANNLGNTWYEVGFNPYAPTTGIPAAGSTLNIGGTNSFVMPSSYVGNNALYIANFGGYNTGHGFVLNNPAAFSEISFLTGAGNGPLVVKVTINHQDTSTQESQLSIPDWFNQPNAAYVANGRFNTTTVGLNDVNSGNPRLSAPSLVVTNTSSPIASINFEYVSGGRGGILAVSGKPASGGNNVPVSVSGYNADLVVEATPQWPPNGIRNFTTATMDGGVNNTGNTWHEQGYYAARPETGLPAPGTVITSLAKSDHKYQMPATYTGPNAAFVDSLRTNVSLTLATPKPYSALSFLSATANGRVTNSVEIQFADGTTETNSFISQDWFNNSPYAFTAAGRVNVNNRTMNNLGSTNPRLYEAEFALVNNVSAVTNVVLRFLGAQNSNGRMVVLAVSATAGAVRPIIATQPSSTLVMEGSNVVVSAVMGGGTPPITYQWYFDAGTGSTAVQNSTLISGANTPNLTFSSIGWTNAGSYYLVAANVAGPSTSAVATVTVRSGLNDVTVPTDEVIRLAVGDAPAGEPASFAINNTTSKYLNWDNDRTAPFDGGIGFTVKPGIGPTLVQALRFYTANDAEERDPTSYSLEGSNDEGGSWTEIGAGPLALPGARNEANQALNPLTQAVQELRLNNTTAYTLYRLTFNTVKGNTDMMQIGEVEFLGTIADIAGPPVVRTDLPAAKLVYAGRTLTLKSFFGGSAPLTYTWRRNETLVVNDARITGANTDTLVIANVQPSDAASYHVTASNAQGSTPSTATTVTVETRPDFNGEGLGWVLNGGAIITNNTLLLTENLGGQARSAWFQDPLYVGSFRASFTYQDVTIGGADGFTFTLQNSPAGTAALGGGGGALAVNGINPSVQLMFNIYNSSGVAIGTNGTRIGDFVTTGDVDLRAGNPIKVDLSYVSGILTATLTDTVSNTVFSTSYSANLPTLAGGTTAYVGFTGATGGATAEQTIRDFVYTPLPAVAVANAGATAVISWPASIGGYTLLSTGTLSGPWASVTAPVTLVNGQYQVSVPTTGTQFYRLSLN